MSLRYAARKVQPQPQARGVRACDKTGEQPGTQLRGYTRPLIVHRNNRPLSILPLFTSDFNLYRCSVWGKLEGVRYQVFEGLLDSQWVCLYRQFLRCPEQDVQVARPHDAHHVLYEGDQV